MSDSNAKEWICRTRIRSAEFQASIPDVTTKGLGLLTAKWEPGQKLSVGFLQGTKKLQERVFETAQRWTNGSEGGANLVFIRAAKPESADIRISFDEGGGSWSMIGTEAKSVAKGEATMNLGWATEQTPESDFASVVLHEFGHAICLLHEHNHPELDLRWKKDVVYADLMGPPNSWSRDEVDFNVFNQYPKDSVVMSDKPDLVSIMIYTIPARWLDGQKAIMPSNKLSADDIDFIRTLYP